MPFNDTNIRWCDKTWNPVHGCSKTSEGCKNCYAERVSHKFGNTDEPWTIEHEGVNIQIKERYLNDRLNEANWVFVNSMSDLYHATVPDEFIQGVYDAIADMPECAFQILTKHGADTDRDIPEPPENAMVGVSVESPRRRYRIDWLREQPTETKFISFEPLVECIPEVDLTGIDWAIIGGESGGLHPDEYKRRVDEGEIESNEHGSDWQIRRPMSPAWARNLVRACRRQDVAVFFKQHSDQKTETRIKLDMGDGPELIEEFPDLPAGILPKPRKHISPPVTNA